MTSCCAVTGLRRNDAAPFAIARAIARSFSSPEQKMIGRSYFVERKHSCSAKPSMSGIVTSSTRQFRRSSTPDRMKSGTDRNPLVAKPAASSTRHVAVLNDLLSSTTATSGFLESGEGCMTEAWMGDGRLRRRMAFLTRRREIGYASDVILRSK